MGKSIVLMILVIACFSAAVLNLAADNKARRTIMTGAVLCAVTVGSVYYGAGYAYCQGLSVSSLFRALLALSRMFGGINDINNVSTFRVPGWILMCFRKALFGESASLLFSMTAPNALMVLSYREFPSGSM